MPAAGGAHPGCGARRSRGAPGSAPTGTAGWSRVAAAPSADALDRLATALLLTEAEREHLFLLGLGRPPEVRYQPTAGVTPRLQRVLDAMDACPALIRTATWDVVAWNRAAAAVLCDYGALPPVERNVLRLMFLDPRRRAADLEWESGARIVVGVFRGEAVRTGAAATVQPLVDELCAKSPDFATMWRESEIRSSCEGRKRLRHPILGEIALEFSAFAVDGRPDLIMLLYTSLTTDDAAGSERSPPVTEWLARVTPPAPARERPRGTTLYVPGDGPLSWTMSELGLFLEGSELVVANRY